LNLSVFLLALVGAGIGWVAGNIGPGACGVAPTSATRMWSAIAGLIAFTSIAVATTVGLAVELLPLLCSATAVLLLLAVCDVAGGQVPDRLAIAGAALCAVLVLGTALAAPGVGSLRWALIGAVAYAVVFGGLWWASDGRMVGGGDVRVAPIVGLVAGFAAPAAVTLTLLVALLSATVWALTRKTKTVAFVPHLLIGVMVALVLAAPLQAFYENPGISDVAM